METPPIARRTLLVLATASLAFGLAPRATAEPSLLAPPRSDGPVVVDAGFRLLDIDEIDDEAETFEFEGVLTLAWRDPRQAFDPAATGVDEKVYQGDYQFDEVFTGWFPQVVLVNESGMYESRGVVLRVSPDGSLVLTQMVNAVAETDLDLRTYPFDRQHLEAVFEVLGFDESEMELRSAPELGDSAADVAAVRIPQWQLVSVDPSVRTDRSAHGAGSGLSAAFVLGMELHRRSLFMVRLVIFPLTLMVMLSWSVFWMDYSSLGDRIAVSFIGILTVVAYQIVLSEILPRISYVTFMNAYLNLSFLAMCATVVVNLRVGALDRRGQSAAGDRIDRRCRWVFPSVYFGLALASCALFFATS